MSQDQITTGHYGIELCWRARSVGVTLRMLKVTPSLVTGGRDIVAGCQFKFKWPALAASRCNVYISSDPAWPERGAQWEGRRGVTGAHYFRGSSYSKVAISQKDGNDIIHFQVFIFTQV